MSPLLKDQLRSLLGPAGFITEPDLLERYSSDWSKYQHFRPIAVARPANVADLARTLALCNAAKQRIVVQGGLTGLCGGGCPFDGELALSTERLTAIEALDEHDLTLTAQAGVTLEKVQQAAANAGFEFPLDFGARGTCTVGGFLSTNAGGNSVIRYGVTRNLVLGVEAVLADGTIVSGMNRMLKNSTGYDLKQLFIGSEGTLGVVTRAVLRLFPQQRDIATAWIGTDSFDGVVRILREARTQLEGGPSAFEVMWQDYVAAALRLLPQVKAPLDRPTAFHVLLEYSNAAGGAAAALERLLEGAIERGDATDAMVPQSVRETEQLWLIRDAPSEIMPTIMVPLIFDVSMPLERMPEYVAAVNAVMNAACPGAPRYYFGHLGDGTLHMLIEGRDPARKDELIGKILAPLKSIGGAVSAEHGVGLAKKAFISLTRSNIEIDLMRALKSKLDPNGILNRGRVFD
jgi:FAD/FMN-containing dehydrogenase